MAPLGLLNLLGKSTCLVLSVILIQINGCKSHNSSQLILDEILTDYDYRLRPNSDGGPVVVSLGLGVEYLGDISESLMEFTATVFLTQSWTDERLTFEAVDQIRLTGVDISSIWIPDVFFPFEIEASLHDVTTPNRKLVLQKNGMVSMLLRATLRMSCPMDLTRYPMDEQTCHISMLSYQHPSTELVFEMNSANFTLPVGSDMSMFRLIGQEATVFEVKYGIENHFCAQASIKLQRRLETYILIMYLPSILLICIAWLSFWIDPKSPPARITMCMTVNLSLNTMSSNLAEKVPAAHGTRAMDVWLSCCQVFLFMALVEYTVANAAMLNEHYKRLKHEKGLKRTQSLTKMPKAIPDVYDHDDDPVEIAYILDRGSRYVFMILFLIFNAAYWFTYLT